MPGAFHRYFSAAALMAILGLFSCGATYTSFRDKTGYDFSNPEKKLTLPDTLREISGITCTGDHEFACIQDENGIVFIYDAAKNEIARQYKFHLDGDYEGITRKGDTLYILRSDGVLFEIDNYKSENFKTELYETGIPSGNNEGLCYDAVNNRLLIACKGKLGKGPEYKDKRAIYAFDLKEKKLSANPVFDFDMQEIRKYCSEQKLSLPTRSKKNGAIEDPVIRFRPSAICIHPLTRRLFLLSAADHMLFIFNMNGGIEHAEVLDPAMFNKAEGITFSENGDALISNEGQEGVPTLLVFPYKNFEMENK